MRNSIRRSSTGLAHLVRALRFGEPAELRRSDVDTSGGVVRVRRGVVRVRVEDGNGVRRMVSRVKSPKSDAGVRDVAIPPHLLPMVCEHLLKHSGPGPDGLLFPGADGGHLAPSSLYGKVTLTNKLGTVTRQGWGSTRPGALLVAAI